VIDTSNLRSAQLQSYVKSLISVPPGQMTLVFQSFGFKHGLPVDADYVFDVRMLPNPTTSRSCAPDRHGPARDGLPAPATRCAAHAGHIIRFWTTGWTC
jgi:hypothetical protein